MSRRAKVALGAWAMGAGVLFGPACKDRLAHIFAAYRYEAGGDCLESAAAVDVVDGRDPGMCAAVRCWISPDGDVYVTSMACDAPSDYVEHTKDPPNSVCARAIAAFAEPGHRACGLDGGSPLKGDVDAPPQGVEASTEAGK